MMTNTIEQKKQLLSDCLLQYSSPVIKYDGSRISTNIPTDSVQTRMIRAAIVIRRIPDDVFSREVDSTITNINDERLAAFIEKHIGECIGEEPVCITDEHQMDIVRDAIIRRLTHWLATGEFDSLLDAEHAIANAKDAALSVSPVNPDKAIQFMLFAAFMYEDETMIIDKADDHLKSYLIESSYIILSEMDFTEVFDK